MNGQSHKKNQVMLIINVKLALRDLFHMTGFVLQTNCCKIYVDEKCEIVFQGPLRDYCGRVEQGEDINCLQLLLSMGNNLAPTING